ncbi:MAG: protein kinase [Kofleriaceae bacterium]|nr:protein kinase [Kofleriaceae bacterium]
MLAWGVCPGEETVAAYVRTPGAGQLSQAERDAVDSHLDTCSACQELVAALAKGLSAGEPRASATSLGAPSTLGARVVETWNPGGQLGRYVVLTQLGAGGMGVVYAAYDPELDRKVAVKVLRRARAGEELKAEARAVARLAHPNVIAVHDVGEADGELYVAMEYVDGASVREWLKAAPRTTDEILDVFVQAGRGLAAAHRAGLVHRDIKPSNIVVGADGRARVVDFGLARALEHEPEPSVPAGTPAYMAPEQKRGEKIDARADQYAFCLALWESLGGKRDDGAPPPGVVDRVVRALRRGLSPEPPDRFWSMEALLAELAPPPPHGRRWVLASGVALLSLGALLVVVLVGRRAAPSCATAGDGVAKLWNARERDAVRSAFAATKLPYAIAAGELTIGQLDTWTASWRREAEGTCRATVVDRVQPAATDALRRSCLDQLLDRLRPVIVLARTADASVVAQTSSLAEALPAPSRCADIAALSALPPLPPAEGARVQIAALNAAIADNETALLAGKAPHIRDAVLEIRTRANALGYLPLQARAQLLVGRMELDAAHYAEGIAELHAAARLATAARDLELLATIWSELAKALGNDLRTQDEAELFDGYASALIAQLPDRESHELDLAWGRCNRNLTAKDAARALEACRETIERAERMSPPKRALVVAARTRLGHFQRLQGDDAAALATLRQAVDESVKFHGEQHPETALARYALGIALVATQAHDLGIAELRKSLAIREVAYPGGSIQVAESLLGLGDALGESGKTEESIALLERGLAILDAIHQGESAHAANSHILVGMSLSDANRPDDALAHYLRAADIADRNLEHREAVAAMALRLAADLEGERGRTAVGIPYLERAIRLLERGKAAPEELGRTQFRLAQFVYAIGRSEHARGRSIATSARATVVAAGPAGAKTLAEIDTFLASHP